MMTAAQPFELRLLEWMLRRGFSWRHLTINRSDGVGSAAAHLILPHTAPRAILVSAHGTGNDALYPQIGLFKHLLAKGYGIFAFDLDGHGRTSTTRLGQETIFAAIDAALQRLYQEMGDVPFSLIGASLGGALALKAAQSHPPGIKSLILVTVPVRFSLRRLNLCNELLSLATPTFLRQREHYGAWGMLPAAGPFKRRAFPVRLAAGSHANYVTAVRDIINAVDALNLAPKVIVPTLCIYGRRDRLAPVADGEALNAALPKSALMILPQTGHLTTALASTTEQAVGEWLDRHHDSRETAKL